MAKAQPQKSCKDAVLKYIVNEAELAAAHRQIQQALQKQTAIIYDLPLENGQVEITVVAASLTPSAKSELEELQKDGVMTRKIKEADFSASQISFGNS